LTLELLSQEEQVAFKENTYEAGAAEKKARYLQQMIVGRIIECFKLKNAPVPQRLEAWKEGRGTMVISSIHTYAYEKLGKVHAYDLDQLRASLSAYRKKKENPHASSSSPTKSLTKSPPKHGTKRPAVVGGDAGPSSHQQSPKMQNTSHEQENPPASSSSPTKSPNKGTKRPAGVGVDAGPSSHKSPKKIETITEKKKTSPKKQKQTTLKFG
jgi:hypothetical protein